MSIPVSERLAAILGSRQFRFITRVTITRGGDVLAADLPVESGREEGDATLRVPERVTVTIPTVIDGVDWSANAADSPIMPFGQRLHVKIGVDVGADGYEWINRGEFLITKVDKGLRTITITAAGLLTLHDEALLVAPFRPTGTLLSSIRKLIEPGLTVVKHPDVVDQAANSGLAMVDNRLDNVEKILAAWGARGQVHPDGYYEILPGEQWGEGATDTDMFLQRRHADEDPTLRPNITSIAASADREGYTNCVVYRGESTTGAPLQVVVYDQSGGPADYRGPFNPFPVPFIFDSGTVELKQLALVFARIMLRQRSAPYRRAWRVDAVPQPRYLINDLLYYFPDETLDVPVRVVIETLSLPYTAASGPMTLTIRELAPDDD